MTSVVTLRVPSIRTVYNFPIFLLSWFPSVSFMQRRRREGSLRTLSSRDLSQEGKKFHSELNPCLKNRERKRKRERGRGERKKCTPRRGRKRALLTHPMNLLSRFFLFSQLFSPACVALAIKILIVEFRSWRQDNRLIIHRDRAPDTLGVR